LDVLDEVDGRTLVNPTLSTNNAMRKDSKILSMLIKEDDDTLFDGDVAGDVDLDGRVVDLCAEGKEEPLEVQLLETFNDNLADRL
jgi:hypothetical protein